MLFATVLTVEHCKTVTRAWRPFDALVNSLPLSDTATLLLFHVRNLLEAVHKGTLDMETLHMTTTRVTMLAEPYLALDEMTNGVRAINAVLDLFL